MSRAKLTQEGHKALVKEDYNAAVEFYTMVCYYTFCGPQVNFVSPIIVVSFVCIALAYTKGQICISRLMDTKNHDRKCIGS